MSLLIFFTQVQDTADALPDFILDLMDPSKEPRLAEYTCAGCLSSAHNVSLDKVLCSLARHAATRKRAVLLFDWLVENNHEFDERLCASMMRICSRRGQHGRAMGIYEWMRRSRQYGGAGLACSVFTYTTAMKAAIMDAQYDHAVGIWNHAKAAIPGEMDSQIYTVLIEALDGKGDFDEAIETFYATREQCIAENSAVYAYTAAITAATHGSRFEEAYRLWDDLKIQGIKPSSHAYSAIITAHGKEGDWKSAVKKFNDMIQCGISANVVTCTSLIDALGTNGCWNKAERILHWMQSKKINPNVRTYTALVSTYAKYGSIDKALDLFDQMYSGALGKSNVPNEYTVSILLRQLAEKGLWKDAETIFYSVQRDALQVDSKKRAVPRIVLNDVIYGSMMYAYERSGCWKQALEVLSLCTASRDISLDTNNIIRNTALSALAKNGQMTAAEGVYADIKHPDQVTYETMIAGYGVAGNAEKAEHFFSLLEKEGMAPHDYAFCGLVAGYSIQGKFHKAVDVYHRARQAGLTPTVHLYNALIACCDRFHKYEKAIAFLQEMKDKNIRGNAMTDSLRVTICTEGVRSVESQQAAITAISAAVAAAGSIMIRAGVF